MQIQFMMVVYWLVHIIQISCLPLSFDLLGSLNDEMPIRILLDRNENCLSKDVKFIQLIDLCHTGKYIGNLINMAP